MISKHLNKNNLHHTYLIEGAREEIVPEVVKFLKGMGIKTSGNPDFVHITIDNFKIDEALDLRGMSTDKSFTSTKKIFIICANTFSLDAQGVLLKMFEEPSIDTHFFLIVPDANLLLKTLISRFYLITAEKDLSADMAEAEKFITMSLPNRIEYIRELLNEPDDEDEEGNEIAVLDSTRSKAHKFLNALEQALHDKFLGNSSGLLQPSAGTFPVQNFPNNLFEHFFKVREFLRMPGSSTKSLMESVALIVPNLPN